MENIKTWAYYASIGLIMTVALCLVVNNTWFWVFILSSILVMLINENFELNDSLAWKESQIIDLEKQIMVLTTLMKNMAVEKGHRNALPTAAVGTRIGNLSDALGSPPQ